MPLHLGFGKKQTRNDWGSSSFDWGPRSGSRFGKITGSDVGKTQMFFFKIDDDPMMIPSLIFVAGSLFSRTKGFHCQETHLVDQETQVLNVLIAMFLKYLSPVSYILTGTLAAAVYHLALFWCARVRLWIIQVNELAVPVTFDFNRTRYLWSPWRVLYRYLMSIPGRQQMFGLERRPGKFLVRGACKDIWK